MGQRRIWARRERSASRRRSQLARSLLVVALTALVAALIDPSVIPPTGPLAMRPERISAEFTRCGRARSFACVVDGDTIRIGQRRVRLIGIDAPELGEPRCETERAAAERSAERLLALVNQGDFELIGHRLRDRDHYGRDLRVLRRDGASLGATMVAEGHAQRYFGHKSNWC